MTLGHISEEDKARIRSEEFFRSELRKELVPPPTAAARRSTRETVWTFLNSSFGLWFLSAVLVSGLGALYTNHQNRLQDETKQREAAATEAERQKELYERLTLEISFRLSAALSRLNEADKRLGDSVKADSEGAIRRALAPLALPASDTLPPLFPEFTSYSGLALIAELRRHAEEGERERLKEILAGTSGLIYETFGDGDTAAQTPRAVASLLLKRMRYSKWDNGFPYTDCSDEAPFC